MANAKNITKVIVGEELYYLKDKQVRDSIGATNGIATLDSSGKVPRSQLPSYVDDVIDAYYYNDTMYEDAEHTIAITPETGKIYIDLHTNESYRWSGTTYIVLSSPYVLPTASANVLGGIKIGENLYIDENGVVSSSMYIPTLQTVPTPSTTTYEKDGKQIPFQIGQFARVVSGDGYEFYQVNDIKNNGTEVVWAAPSYLIPSVYSAPTAKVLTYNTEAQALLNAGSTENGVIQYSSDGTNWSNDVPTATNAGDYTVYWKLIGDSTHTNVPKTAIGVTIDKAAPTYTAPSAKILTYSGSALELLNAGSSSHGSFKYSADNENWSDTIPSLTNAGNYTVYWKFIGDANHTDVDSTQVSVTIDKAAPTYTAPSAKNPTYNGSAQLLLNAGSTNHGEIKYSADNENWGDTIPSETNAGEYVAYWKLIGDSNHTDVNSTSVSVTINKATPTYTAPTAKSPTYNGSAQALLNAGSTSHGTIEYSRDNSSWSTSIPTATSAGTKTTYWRLNGDANHTSISALTINVTIAKADLSAPGATGATVAYGNTATASASGGGGQGSIEWSNGNSLSGNAGSSKTTSARWSGNGNYNPSPYSNTVTLSIVKANQSAPTATGATVDYGSTATATASGGGGQGSIEWSNGSTRTAVGSQSTQARWSGNSNYNASPWSNSVTLTVRTTHVGYEVVDLGLPSGTKWAKQNVGASNETGYGSYYMYGKGNRAYNNSDSPYTGTESPLSMSVDTARQAWGGSWHMPTKAQFEELLNNTTYSKTTINGVTGGKYTAPNGNYIFLPCAGRYFQGTAYYVGVNGRYWSATPKDNNYVYYLSVDTSSSVNGEVRYSGYSIRPVLG